LRNKLDLRRGSATAGPLLSGKTLILENVAGERLGITTAAHSEITFEFTGPNLHKASLSHLQIGNVELERSRSSVPAGIESP
jgi:hypothetical protein